MKLFATAKQIIRRNSICCLRNQAIFHRVSIEIGLTPPLPLFVFKGWGGVKGPPYPPPPYSHPHNKLFTENGLLEEMEGVNDNGC